MPRIIEPAEILKDPKSEVMKLIASLNPGQSAVLQEFCEEHGFTKHQMVHHIPAGNKLIARIKGYRKPVILITCPASSPPQTRTKRK